MLSVEVVHGMQWMHGGELIYIISHQSLISH